MWLKCPLSGGFYYRKWIDYCLLYGVVGVRYSGVSDVSKSMEKQSGLSELSVISWVSAVEGCPLSGVPLCCACLVCIQVYISIDQLHACTGQ